MGIVEWVTYDILRDNLAIAGLHKLFDVINEIIDAREEFVCELLDIVVASTLNVKGWVLMLGGLVQLLRVIEGDNFIACTMNDVDWAINVWHAVYVRELVEREGPAEIQCDAKDGHQARVKDYATEAILLRQKASRPRPD